MQVDLNGLWQATADLGQQARAGRPGADLAGWTEIPVPGHWDQAPAFRGHTGPVLYRRSFTLEGPPAQGEAARLCFAGVFAAAKVWCNGSFVGEHEGYFMPANYDVTRLLRGGENVVMVEVAVPTAQAAEPRRQISAIYGGWDSKPPRAHPGGIWRDVSLAVYPGVIPERLSVQTLPEQVPGAGADPDAPVPAELRLALDYTAVAEGDLRWEATLTPETFAGPPLAVTGQQGVRRGWNRLSATVEVPSARLWWTWDQGTPHLYRLTLKGFRGETEAFRLERLVGFRTVQLRGSVCFLNGRRLFLRGTAYAGPAVHMAAVDGEAYQRDVRLMAEAHVNLLRVYGHVDRPELYEAASRQGLLVWQDFPLFGRHARSVLPSARRQAAALADLLGHWPCLGLWVAHADPEPLQEEPLQGMQGWLSGLAALTGNWDRTTLAPAVRDALAEADMTRPCLATPHDLGAGRDTRPWWGWRTGRLQDMGPAVEARSNSIAFVTEFGAQAFPSQALTAQLVRGEWPGINWGDLARDALLSPHLLERNVPHSLAPTLHQYAAATQQYQAFVIRYSIELFRIHKHRPCGGAVQHLFADLAPGVSYGLLDAAREPRPAYQALAQAYRPVLIIAEWPRSGYPAGERVTLPVWLVNDRHTALEGRWRWDVERDGQRLAGGEFPARMPPDDAVPAVGEVDWEIPTRTAPGMAELVLTLELFGYTSIVHKYALGILPPISE